MPPIVTGLTPSSGPIVGGTALARAETGFVAGAGTVAVTVGSASGSVAIAGHGSASVSWSAPTSSGSFPVSHYLAISTPSLHQGLVAVTALTCDVGNLTIGTAYILSVKALTGAGWSPASDPSNAVVTRPQSKPSIIISGSRDGQLIEVSGSTTGFGMGAILNPWVRHAGQSSDSQGAARVSFPSRM